MLFHSLMQTGACKPYCLCEWCPWFVYYTVLSGTAVLCWCGVTTPINSESHWIIWLLKQHTGPSRTECPQLLTLSSSLSTLTLLPTLKPTLFPPSPLLPFPVLHPPPLVGVSSKLVLQTGPGNLSAFPSPHLGPHHGQINSGRARF